MHGRSFSLVHRVHRPRRAWRALIYVANHLVKTLAEDRVATTTVSLPQYVVLAHLSEPEHQRLRIGDLVSISALSHRRVSRLVDEMAAKGQVTTTRQVKDGRCTLDTLTPRGLRTLQATYPTQLRNVRRRVFDLLSPDEVDELSAALWKNRDGLNTSVPSAATEQ